MRYYQKVVSGCGMDDGNQGHHRQKDFKKGIDPDIARARRRDEVRARFFLSFFALLFCPCTTAYVRWRGAHRSDGNVCTYPLCEWLRVWRW